jgi:RNA polymerase sigma-70 factor (ECF subfamily)
MPASIRSVAFLAWVSEHGCVKVGKAVNHDEQWIGIYRGTIEPLYRFVARRTGGAVQLTEDVVQETYLRGIDRFGEAKAPREPLAWLQTVARNLLVSHFRRVAPASVDPVALDALLERGAAGDAETIRSVQAGLARLGDGKARLLEAFHLDGKDVRTIAAEWGISERAVEGRLRRARLALRKELSHE